MDAGQLLSLVLMLVGLCWAAYLAFSDWRPPGPRDPE